MKQTVEEAAKTFSNHLTVSDVVKNLTELAFNAGAKWQAKQSPWISVKERLPEEGDPVLIRLKDGVVRLACYDIEEDSNIYFWNDNYSYETIRAWDVTHWCYIPYFDNNYKLSKE